MAIEINDLKIISCTNVATRHYKVFEVCLVLDYIHWNTGTM